MKVHLAIVAASAEQRRDALYIVRDFSVADAKLAARNIRHDEVYVAVFEGSVVGVTGIIPDDLSTRVAWLGWTYVRASRRGAGIGTALLRFVERLVKHRRQRLFITTEGAACYKAALRFYLRNGYKIRGRLPGFYPDGTPLLILGTVTK